jgi:hypothetical protein
MAANLFRLAVVLLATHAVAAPPAAFQFSFWPGPGARQDRRVLRIVQHPCGQVAVARVTVLPGVSQSGSLIAEAVVEVDAAGETVRRWRVPVDAYPIAFRGNGLIFASGNATYRVDPAGRVSRYTGPKPTPASPFNNCSGAIEFPGSAYATCQTLTDLVTGKPRYIRFEAPCS